jgi:peptidoglycan/LPS O-acetylase OafA/YrhL
VLHERTDSALPPKVSGCYLALEMAALQSIELKTKARYPIIDALRFTLALWVVLDHLGVFPLFGGIDIGTRLGRTLTHAWSSTIWGIPAVICFFVISGFCIHLPYRFGGPLLLGPFYIRRYVRILVPVGVFLFIYRHSGVSAPIIGRGSLLWRSVLWSLACEEIYYAIYPLARWIRLKHGWKGLLSGTFVIGIAAAVAFPNALDGSLLGTLQIAVILYPIWLLGCFLVEECDRLPVINSALEIWKWRFFAWSGSWICEMVHFKGKLSLGRTLICFGVLAFFWIRQELAYSKHKSPLSALAWGGLWSYSVYLVHGPAALLFARLRTPDFGYTVNWCVYYAFVFGLSYIFYLCIEQPSHKLARMLSLGKLRPPHAATQDDFVAEAPSKAP